MFSFLKEMAKKGKPVFTQLPSRCFVINISSEKKPTKRRRLYRRKCCADLVRSFM